MNVILDIAIAVKGRPIHTMLRKQINTDLFPFPSVHVEDSAWKDPKLALYTTCNFEVGYYLLNFKTIELDTDELCIQEVEMYRLHGWRKPDEWI